MSTLTVSVLQFYVYTTVPTHLSDVHMWSQLFLVCSITVHGYIKRNRTDISIMYCRITFDAIFIL